MEKTKIFVINEPPVDFDTTKRYDFIDDEGKRYTISLFLYQQGYRPHIFLTSCFDECAKFYRFIEAEAYPVGQNQTKKNTIKITLVVLNTLPMAFTKPQCIEEHYYNNNGYWILTCGTLIQSETSGEAYERTWNTKGITKPRLMAYLIAVLGPLSKEELLKYCAFLEHKSWRPNSNGDYFLPSKEGSVVSKKILYPITVGRRVGVYSLDILGLKYAAETLPKLGRDPALLAQRHA